MGACTISFHARSVLRLRIQNNDDEDVVLPSPIPPEAFEHRGKWLALHNREILAVRDTEEELEEEFGDRGHEVSFFHVSPTPIYAR